MIAACLLDLQRFNLSKTIPLCLNNHTNEAAVLMTEGVLMALLGQITKNVQTDFQKTSSGGPSSMSIVLLVSDGERDNQKWDPSLEYQILFGLYKVLSKMSLEKKLPKILFNMGYIIFKAKFVL